MNRLTYTSEELQGKFIACSVLLSGKRPVLDCVRHATGPDEGKPYLYNSIQAAESDKFFDKEYDEVLTAEGYFRRVNLQENKIIKP
jgi:hypothetical protein